MPARELKPVNALSPIAETNTIAGNPSPFILNIKKAIPDKAPLSIAQSPVATPIANLPEVASAE